jgi:hypothetical protein
MLLTTLNLKFYLCVTVTHFRRCPIDFLDNEHGGEYIKPELFQMVLSDGLSGKCIGSSSSSGTKGDKPRRFGCACPWRKSGVSGGAPICSRSGEKVLVSTRLSKAGGSSSCSLPSLSDSSMSNPTHPCRVT